MNVVGAMPTIAVVALRNLEAQYKTASPQQCFSNVFKGCQSLGTKGTGSKILNMTAAGTGQYPQTKSTTARVDFVNFDRMARGCPAFATEYAAITTRYNINHYGPLKRGEAPPFESCRPLLKEIAQFISEKGAVFCQALGNGGDQNTVVAAMRGTLQETTATPPMQTARQPAAE